MPNTRVLANYLRLIVLAVVLAMIVSIVLRPDVAYGAMQRALVFMLGGLLAGMLFGGEVGNRLEIKGAGFVLTLVGSSAIAAAAGYGLWWVTKPQEVATAFVIEDERGQELNVSAAGVLMVRPVRGAVPELPTFRDGAMFIVILDRGDEAIKVEVRDPPGSSRVYHGVIPSPERARARLKLFPDNSIRIVKEAK